MPFDAAAFVNELNKAGQLKPEELAVLQGALGKPEVAKYLEENQLRQSDYSRAMNALREKETATTALQQQLVEWKAAQEKVIDKANLTVRQEREARARLEAVVKAKADEFGLNADEILSAAPPATPTPAPTTQPQNLDEFLKKQDWQNELNGIRSQFPLLPATLFDLASQQQKLFGKGFDEYSYTPKAGGAAITGTQALVLKAMETGKSIQGVWEEDFKVAERRTQIQEESIQQRIRQGVEAEVAKFRSENNLPAPAPQAARSPILAEFKPPTQDRSQMDPVDAAVARFNELTAPGASQGANGA